MKAPPFVHWQHPLRHPQVSCGAEQVRAPWRTDDAAAVTCRRCRLAVVRYTSRRLSHVPQ